MALHTLLNYKRQVSRYPEASKKFDLQIQMVPCDELNETFSVPINKKTRIIHYKGGWRSILFEEGPFTKNRTKMDSWEMYIFYIKSFKKALEKINTRLSKNYSLKEFGFTIPFYIDKKTYSENPVLYFLYKLRWQVKNFFPRLKRRVSR